MNLPLLLSACFISPAIAAFWPFPTKRFTGNSLIDAGSLGLKGDGRIVAFGDFNGDQLYVPMLLLHLDAFTRIGVKARRPRSRFRPTNIHCT